MSGYLDKLKDKYNIKTSSRSKYLTVDEYETAQNKFKKCLKELWHNSEKGDKNKNKLKKTIESCLTGKYRVLELWETPETDTPIKWIYVKKGKIYTGQGVVIDSDELELTVRGPLSEKIDRISRTHLIFVPFTESQLTMLELQKKISN